MLFVFRLLKTFSHIFVQCSFTASIFKVLSITPYGVRSTFVKANHLHCQGRLKYVKIVQ